MTDVPKSHKVNWVGMVNSLLKAANGGDEEEGPVARHLREKKLRKAKRWLKARNLK